MIVKTFYTEYEILWKVMRIAGDFFGWGLQWPSLYLEQLKVPDSGSKSILSDTIISLSYHTADQINNFGIVKGVWEQHFPDPPGPRARVRACGPRRALHLGSTLPGFLSF